MSELVQNGDFSSAQYWDVQNLWSVTAGKVKYLMGGTPYEGEYLGQTVDIDEGDTYRLTFTVDSVSLSGTTYLRASVGGMNSEDITEADSFNISFTAQNTDGLKFEILGSGAQSGDEVTIDDVSLVYQPVISQRYGSKTYSDGERTITRIISTDEFQG